MPYIQRGIWENLLVRRRVVLWYWVSLKERTEECRPCGLHSRRENHLPPGADGDSFYGPRPRGDLGLFLVLRRAPSVERCVRRVGHLEGRNTTALILLSKDANATTLLGASGDLSGCHFHLEEGDKLLPRVEPEAAECLEYRVVDVGWCRRLCGLRFFVNFFPLWLHHPASCGASELRIIGMTPADFNSISADGEKPQPAASSNNACSLLPTRSEHESCQKQRSDNNILTHFCFPPPRRDDCVSRARHNSLAQ